MHKSMFKKILSFIVSVSMTIGCCSFVAMAENELSDGTEIVKANPNEIVALLDNTAAEPKAVSSGWAATSFYVNGKREVYLSFPVPEMPEGVLVSAKVKPTIAVDASAANIKLYKIGYANIPPFTDNNVNGFKALYDGALQYLSAIDTPITADEGNIYDIENVYSENSDSSKNLIVGFVGEGALTNAVIAYNTSELEFVIDTYGSVNSMTADNVYKYVKYYKGEDYTYFDFNSEDMAAINEKLVNQMPFADSDEFIAALDRAISGMQIFTNPERDAQEVDLNTTEIELTFADNIEIDAATLIAGNFSLKDESANPISFSLSENKIIINEALQPETKYTLSWSGLKTTDGKGLIDSSSTFQTAGVYTSLWADMKNYTMVGENLSADVQGTFESGREQTLLWNDMSITSSDNEIVIPSEGVFNALKRGTVILTFKAKNADDTFTEIKRNAAVCNKDKVKAYDEEVNVTNETQNLTSEFDADFIAGDYIADKDIKLNIGNSELVLTGDGKQHSFAVDMTGETGEFYIDGEKIKSIGKEVFRTAAVSSQSDAAVIKNVCLCNVGGSVCYADFVTARYVKDVSIKGDYKYNDADTDEEIGTEMKWYSSSSQGGTYSLISGESTKTLSDYASYKGKYVKFEVTPKNIYEVGATVSSEPVYITPDENPDSSSPSRGGGGGVSFSAPIVAPHQNNEETKPVTPAKAFNDVAENHWAKADIEKLAALNVLNGFEDGSFKPENPVTRAEFVCALVKLLGVETVSYDDKFNDVKKEDWCADFIATALTNGFVNGFDDGSFKPDDTITREQMAVITVNALKLTESTELAFSDTGDISDWAVEAIKKAVKYGIITGNNDNTFSPKANTTRAQMAAVLNRINEIKENL